MNNLNDKIQYIDNLINSDDELNKYIALIEKQSNCIPLNLEDKLISQFTPINSKNRFAQNTFNILKIVACTSFALIMWNYLTVFETMMPSLNSNEQITFYENTNSYLEEKLKLANEFLLTPKKFERNDI